MSTNNSWPKIFLKILKLYLISILCILPILAYSIIFTNGKIPSYSIVLCFLFGALINSFWEFRSVKPVGLILSKKNIFDVLTGILISLSYFCVVLIFNIIIEKTIDVNDVFNFSFSSKAFVSILGYYLLVSFSEEIFFRGYILNLVLKYRKHAIPALVLQALLFSVIHIVNPTYNSIYTFIFTFIFGLLLGYISICQGNIIGVIALHLTNNVLSDFLKINENPLNMAVSLLIMILVSLLVYRKKGLLAFIKKSEKKQAITL